MDNNVIDSIREKEKINISSLGLEEPDDDNVKVILHTDDRTPMEFVVAVLHTVFGLELPDCMDIMLKAHNNGSAVIGTYSYEVASSKVEEAKFVIAEAKMPLKITLSEY